MAAEQAGVQVEVREGGGRWGGRRRVTRRWRWVCARGARSRAGASSEARRRLAEIGGDRACSLARISSEARGRSVRTSWVRESVGEESM